MTKQPQTWRHEHSEPHDTIHHVSSWTKFQLAVEEAKVKGFKKIASYQRRANGIRVYLTGTEKEIENQLSQPSELKRFYVPNTVKWLEIKS